MASADEILYESLPCIRIFTSGRVERYFGSEFTPASPAGSPVASKDAAIAADPPVSGRLYLPAAASPGSKLPLVVYFHGGGFCLGSAFNPIFHSYFNNFASLASAVVVSVEYRLAPEHPVPAAYADCWTALRWVAAHASDAAGAAQESWLADYADFDNVYLGGESAGANLAHHVAMRAAAEGLPGGVKIRGLLLIHPYFLGTDTVESEAADPATRESLVTLWKVMCPGTSGTDDPLINPFVGSAPPLAELPCERVLVCVAEKDVLRDRGRAYLDRLVASGWPGEAELYVAAGVGHTFHLLALTSEPAVAQDNAICEFLRRGSVRR